MSPWRRSRATLAWVLGSLDSELATRNLLVALDSSSYDTTIPRWLVYALGIWNGDLTRENRFDFSLESPWVVEGPTGLRVPIACRIDDEDEDAVTALVPLLEHEDLELRRAAIASSRHSLYVDRLREAFRQRLPVESEVGNQAEVAEALAGLGPQQRGLFAGSRHGSRGDHQRGPGTGPPPPAPQGTATPQGSAHRARSNRGFAESRERY